MSAMFELTLQQARLLHLHAQGLAQRPRARATPTALVDAISRMQMLQIDTIHVVARSPWLTLFARIGAFPHEWLGQLLADGLLAECWAHEACFVPSTTCGLHRACQPMRAQHWAQRHARRTLVEHAAGMQALLAHIREHGSVRASDFRRNAASGDGWWSWKPEKRWLEAWFALGELMVVRRDQFQRVYDLADRVRARHPAGTLGEPTREQARWLANAQSVRALGIATASWIGDYFRLPRVASAELRPMVEEGVLLQGRVRGWDLPVYVHRDHAHALERACAGNLRASHTCLLSPFDPVVWDRARAQALFGFGYTLECYVPAVRRQFGYFVLPILRRGRLVGRLDAKAHRAAGLLEVKGLWMEPGLAPAAAVATDIARTIVDFARWHACSRATLQAVRPQAWRRPLRMALHSMQG